MNRRAVLRRLARGGFSTGGLALAPRCRLVAPADPPRHARVALLASSRPASARWQQFVDGLRDLGWVEGNNVAFEWVIADGANERLPALAAELVRRTDIIVTGGTPEVLAVRAASTSIPVVMSGVG